MNGSAEEASPQSCAGRILLEKVKAFRKGRVLFVRIQ